MEFEKDIYLEVYNKPTTIHTHKHRHLIVSLLLLLLEAFPDPSWPLTNWIQPNEIQSLVQEVEV